MPEFDVSQLLQTDTVALRSVRCAGSCSHRSAEECATATQLVFPYRGVYIRQAYGQSPAAFRQSAGRS